MQVEVLLQFTPVPILSYSSFIHNLCLKKKETQQKQL